MNDPTATPEHDREPAGFSVLILTLNEERELPGCLASVSRCDDIVVLDSGSTDRTADIARAAGARVFVRSFDNFAAQRNHAQREIPFKYPWVFHLDADERMSPELRVECGGALWEEENDGFLATPKVICDGKWIRRSANFPSPEVRFVRAPEFEFVRASHGQCGAPNLRIGKLFTCYLHNVCSHGETDCLERWRRRARHAARQHLETESSVPLVDVFASDRLRRQCAFKRLGHALPAAPLLRFVSRYFLHGGFLDGRAGLRYCLLLARYEAFLRTELRRMRATR